MGLVVTVIPLVLLAAGGSPDEGYRFFQLDEPIDAGLVRKAYTDSAAQVVLSGAISSHFSLLSKLPPSPTHLARPFPMIMIKQCWLYSEACRQLGQNKALARQARELMGWSGPLYVRTVQIIPKARGTVHRLHTDLDMWAPECAGKQSATVWTLVSSDADKNRRLSASDTPLRMVSGSHKLHNVTADHFLANTGCWSEMLTWPGRQCSLDTIVTHARRVWPDAGLELLSKGPVRSGEGVAWLGHVWHATKDTFSRKTLLLQYGTEACVRAVRPPYAHFDVRKRWRGPDRYPFFPVNDLPSPQPLALSAPLDKYYLPGAAGAGECVFHVDEATGQRSARARAPARLNRPKVVLRAEMADAKTSWEAPDGASRVRDWPGELRTASLDHLSARRRVWRARSKGVRPPRAAYVDEVCVMLRGSVQYAVSLERTCGPGNTSAFTADAGHVNWLPTGAYHTAAGNGVEAQELCVTLMPRGRKRARGRPTLNFVQIHALQTALLGGDAVPASEKIPVSGGPALKLGGTLETPIWSVSHAHGYKHLRAWALSMGAGGSYTHAGRHDLVVVPLGEGVLRVLEGAHAWRDLAVGDFAVLPEGAERSFKTEHGADAVFIEVKV
mmetsp:Transcript_17792/g.46016  ORF Transcript_17792/g.46016 Transcript_17792/m.46016 type:complete len:612 (+) Transcript_17792:24-1859(+)